MSRVIRLSRVPASLRRRLIAAQEGSGPCPKQKEARSANVLRLIPETLPHDLLWAAVSQRWPDRAVREYAHMVPGRKIRGDIAFPADRLVIEVDGWQYHGRHLADFQRDRTRQNLLTIAGWRILRFAAGAIRSDTAACCALIALALSSPET